MGGQKQLVVFITLFQITFSWEALLGNFTI